MPVVTKIVQGKRDPQRANIYLNGEFAFSVDLENLVKLKIKAGKVLTDEQIQQIIQQSEYTKHLLKLIKFATVRPRSEKEIYDWFHRKKIHENIQKKLFNRMKSLGLLGDENFAQWWVNQRMQFRPKSVMELKAELLKKGIDPKIIADAIAGAGIDEVVSASNLLLKNEYRWKRYDTKARNQKAGQYLARKGYSWDSIKNALKKAGFD